MSEDDSKIEQLKKKLYSKENDVLPTHHGKLHPHTSMVQSSWDTPIDEQYPKVGFDPSHASSALHSVNVSETSSLHQPPPSTYQGDPYAPTDHGPLLKKILIGAGIFFIIAAAVTGFIFYRGINVVSPNNIDIKLLGPVSNPAGEVLSLDVDVTNNNTSDIELADLVMTYPDGTRSADDGVTQMITDRVPIGTIQPGQTIKNTVKSILFGEENSQKDIKVSLEYRVPGSDSIFVKNNDYPIFIGSSPVTLNVDTLKEISADQTAQFKVTLTSNSSSVIKNLLLKVDYPFGFEFASSTPLPLSGNDTWAIGDLQPGDTREIDLSGLMVGQDASNRVFNFSAGTVDPDNTTSIATVFVTNSQAVAVAKPFLGADISLSNSGSSTVVADAGDVIRGEITFQNNLTVPVNDVIIQAKLSGEMLDETNVFADQGYYRSIDNTLLWDKTTAPALQEVEPGATGRVDFTFASLPPNTANNSNFRRPAMGIDLTVQAKRLDENNVPQQITSTATRKIQIQSGLAMSAQLVRTVGPFQNTGPLPPKADQASTYTVLVNVANSFNTVKGAVFTTTLPSYVSWLGVVNPASSTVSYNADSRQITWTLGDLIPGTGYNSSAKEFAFQVSLLPSISQVGTSPVMINAMRVAGQDAFTNTTVEDLQPPLDTKIDNDPDYQYGIDKVSP